MKGDRQTQMLKGQSWRILLWFFILWMFVAYFVGPQLSTQPVDLSYTAFRSRVEQGQVEQVTVKGDQITGSFKKPQAFPPEGKTKSSGERQGEGTKEKASGEKGSKEQTTKHERFKTTLPSFGDPELFTLLTEHGVTVNAESSQSPWYVNMLANLLPWALLIGLFVYLGRKFQQRMGGQQNPFSFGKSKAKLYDKSTSEVSFDDVAGLENSKKELLEIVGFLKEPERYRKLGGELPKGLLLVGPPGTGKTLLARATAGEAGVPFYSTSGSEFIEMFVGVGASRVRDMFRDAKRNAPSIVFIDELDSIGRVRGTGLGGGHDEREQTLNQILSEMDGFEPHEAVVVMAATNRPDILDPALVRPGRFDRRVTLDMPQRKARRQILEIHTREVPLSEQVDLEDLAGRTMGFSGADLENLVNEASLLAARRESEEVEPGDFDRAVDKIRMGTEREDMLNQEETELVAYHEAGHTLVARNTPGADPVEKVTIVPRGRSLGATEQIPEEDRHTFKQSYLSGRLSILLGGRAAERLRFDELTNGAGDDLKKATQLARKMVCQWGMSDKVGPVTYKQGDTHPFLGRELTEPKDFSEHTAQLIDEEVHRLVAEAEERAAEILRSRNDELDRVARALQDRETLTAKDLDEILEETEEDSAA